MIEDIKFASMGAGILIAILRPQSWWWLYLARQGIDGEIKAQNGEWI